MTTVAILTVIPAKAGIQQHVDYYVKLISKLQSIKYPLCQVWAKVSPRGGEDLRVVGHAV